MSDEKEKKTPRLSPERKHLLMQIGIVFLILGLLWFLYWLLWGRFDIFTDDAYVAGNQVQLMAQVSGTVTTIKTDDTFLALEGEPLLKLDPTDAQNGLKNAEANLANTVRSIRQNFETVEQAKAQLTLRKADLEKAKLDFNRRVGLVGQRAISSEEMQHYKTAFEAASAQYQYTLHQYLSALSLVENTDLYHQPSVEIAKAEYRKSYLNLYRTIVFSPIKGYVAKRSVQVGQQVTPGTALMSVVSLDDVWAEANFKENQLSRIRIGQEVDVVADANDFTYHGKVVGIGAGTGSVFSLLPPQNATGNWIKIVQRIPVRIGLDPKELKEHPLQLGLSVRVTVYSRWLRGKILPKAVNNQTQYKTTIFDDQLKHAEADIQKILANTAPNMSLTKDTQRA